MNIGRCPFSAEGIHCESVPRPRMVFGQRKHRASISRIPMLVATFGLLPAAMSHAIGCDSQRLFAIIIFGGLISGLVMSIFLLPTLYVWVSRDGDKLPNLNRAS